jgi:predicted nucleic acid-binding protein
MAQPRVKAEVAAVINVVDICGVEGFSVIGSKTVLFKISKIKKTEKLLKIMGLYFDTVTVEAAITDEVETRAAELMAQGVKELDAYHVSLAESAGADYLLTTDDRLETAALRLGVKTKVINPINFLQEYAIWLQRST